MTHSNGSPPVVSVVIPTYNQADTLGRAIDSVLEQTFEDLELLVVDDGSADGTAQVVEGFDDGRVSYIAHDENQGASVARNTGIETSEGAYLAFLDSDDEWLPRKLERQLSVLRERSREWIGVYCDARLAFSGSTGPIQRTLGHLLADDRPETPKEGGSELIKHVLSDEVQTHAGSSLLVRREAVEAVDGFDESFQRFQDPEFLIRLLEDGKVAYVDEQLLVRYDPQETPPADVVERANRRFLSTFTDHVERLESQGHDITAVHYLSLAKLFFRDGNFPKGARYLRRASLEPRRLPGVGWAVAVGVYQEGKHRVESLAPRRLLKSV